MDISPQVASALAALSRSLDGPESTLVGAVERLCAAVQAAVESFCGVAVIVGTSSQVLEVTVRPGASSGAMPRARSSLRIGSSMLTNREPRLELVLYASQERAFAHLASDVAALVEVSPYVVELDRHVDAFGRSDSLDGLTSAASVDQAVGALLGQGLTPTMAHNAIRARAERDGGDLGHAARCIVEELARAATDGRKDERP